MRLLPISKKLNLLVNSAYRGESSKAGWTTEADLLDGIRMDEERLTEMIQKKNSIILKYEENEKILACVHLEKREEGLYLGMLTVSPALQGKGIGKMLINESEKVAAEMNCNKVFMTVISARTELIDWYLRHGYVNTGKTKPFPAGDPRFGIPKVKIEFVVLEKAVSSEL